MSRGLEEGHIWETAAVIFSSENRLNWLSKATRAGQSSPGVQKGNILDLIPVTLSTENAKNISQSALE